MPRQVHAGIQLGVRSVLVPRHHVALGWAGRQLHEGFPAPPVLCHGPERGGLGGGAGRGCRGQLRCWT